MISTGGTLVKASEALIKRGATEVYCLATHGIFAGDAIKQFEQSAIRKVIVTNTIPTSAHPDGIGNRIEQLSIAQILADAIKRITANRSVSELFAGDESSNLRPPQLLKKLHSTKRTPKRRSRLRFKEPRTRHGETRTHHQRDHPSASRSRHHRCQEGASRGAGFPAPSTVTADRRRSRSTRRPSTTCSRAAARATSSTRPIGGKKEIRAAA